MKPLYLSVICILSLCCGAQQKVVSLASPEMSASPEQNAKAALKIQEFVNGKATLTYFFDNTNRLIRSEPADRTSVTIEHNGNELIEESERDLDYFTSELASNGIKIPFPDIIFNEVAAMAKILIASKADQRFAKKWVNGIAPNSSMRLKGLNKAFRFHPFGIGIMDDEKIIDYQLDLKDGLPAHESLSTAGSKVNGTGPKQLSVQFDHKDGRLIRLISIAEYSADGKQKKHTTEKTFVYSKIE